VCIYVCVCARVCIYVCVHACVCSSRGYFTGFIIAPAGSSAVSNIEVYPSCQFRNVILKYPHVLAKRKEKARKKENEIEKPFSF